MSARGLRREWLGRKGATGLSVDGAAIAAALTLREGTALCLPKVAYDPPWSKYHPGRTLWLLKIGRAVVHSIQKFDVRGTMDG